jgi:hypothetical protein
MTEFTPQAEYVANLQSSAKWYAAAHGGIATAALAGISIHDFRDLSTAVAWTAMALLASAAGIALVVLWKLGDVLSPPRTWTQLTEAEQSRCVEVGCTRHEVARWERSAQERARAVQAKRQTADLIWLDQVGDAFKTMRAVFLRAGLSCLVLIVAAAVLLVSARASTNSLSGTSAPLRVTVALRPGPAPIAAVRTALGDRSCTPGKTFQAVEVSGPYASPTVVIERTGDCPPGIWHLSPRWAVAIPSG